MLNDEFIVRDHITSYESFLKFLDIMISRGYITVESGIVKVIQEEPIKFLSSLLLPFIESYWITLSFLTNMKQQISLTKNVLAQKIQWLAETLYHEGYLVHFDCCSLESIGNSLSKLVNLEILTSMHTNHKHQHPRKKFSNQSDDINEYFVNPEASTIKNLTLLYERMAFFKPMVAFKSGVVSLEHDIKRILASNLQ